LRSSDRKLFIYTHGRGIWTADLTNDPVASIQSHHLPKVRIYPNPADNHVQIESEFDLVNVYSLTGEKMGTYYQNDISTSSLQNGTYFFEVVNGSQISTKKVIIAHP
jgi:hypothetical protein